jgi:large subunit ribosomal protein L13Ae
MVPHKTARGVKAMSNLTVYEGIPHPFDKVSRKVIPQALKTLRLKPHRNFCRLGDLAAKVGWKHDALMNSLEEKRKTGNKFYFQTKKQLASCKAAATKQASGELKKITDALATYGY